MVFATGRLQNFWNFPAQKLRCFATFFSFNLFAASLPNEGAQRKAIEFNFFNLKNEYSKYKTKLRWQNKENRGDLSSQFINVLDGRKRGYLSDVNDFGRKKMMQVLNRRKERSAQNIFPQRSLHSLSLCDTFKQHAGRLGTQRAHLCFIGSRLDRPANS